MAKFSLFMRQFLMFSALATAVFLSSCKDDAVVPNSTVAFGSGSTSIAENSGEHTVTVSLSAAAPAAGTVTVTVANGTDTEDADYTLSPAAANGNITLDFASGASSMTFSITPTDNDELDGDKTITFTLASAAGGIDVGTGTVTYTLTITDDEEPVSYTEISDVRAKWDVDNDLVFDTEMLIKGVVTSTNGNVQSRNLFLQDANAGILIRFDEDNTFEIGDELQIDLNGTTLGDYQNLIQITEITPANVTKLGTAELPAYQQITIEQLNSGAFQAMRVEIVDASFPAADGVTTYGDNRGNNTITDASGEAIVRAEGGGIFADVTLPFGSGTLRGVADVFGETNQLRPIAADDVFTGEATVTITTSVSELADFGQVTTGEMSAAVSYTVTTTGLGTDGVMTIEAPAGFMISLTEDGTYEAMIEVTGDVTEQAVFVKFAPTSGASQTYTGMVKHTAAGAIPVEVAVSGEELGTDPTEVSIADIRAMYNGEKITLELNSFIKGVVTTDDNNVTSRNFFMQDASAGIAIRFASSGDIPDPRFMPGDEVIVNLTGASLEAFRGLVQVSDVTMDMVEKVGTAELPAYQTITIEQLNSDAFQGMLVQVENVSFPAADGTLTFGDDTGNGDGNNAITDGTNTAIVRTGGGSSFASTVIPSGTGTVRGVASIFDDAQLLPIADGDIFP